MHKDVNVISEGQEEIIVKSPLIWNYRYIVIVR